MHLKNQQVFFADIYTIFSKINIELVLHELRVEFYTNLLSNANKQCY